MQIKTSKTSRVFYISFVWICLWCFSSPHSLSAQERFRRDVPDPDPLPFLNLPEIEPVPLSNGLGLTVIHQNKTPMMFLRMVISKGENSSPENLPGLATFTANMLNRGAGSLNSDQIEEAIESIGGKLDTAVFPDYSMFSFSFLEENLDKALEILRMMFMEPTFLKLEIDNIKRTMFYDIRQKLSDPEFLAKKILYHVLFHNHPFKNIMFNDDVIKNYDREALLSFFDSYYRPNNAQIVLIGNINLNTATRKVTSHFNQWINKDIEEKEVPLPQPNSATKICFIDLPRAKDATIYMGNILSPEIKDNIFPLLVFNQVLGGTPNNRLFMNLRESKAFAYWAFSEIEFFNQIGLFFIRAKVKPESIYSSVSEIIREIQNAAQNRIPSSEIERAKSYLIGNFPLTINTMDQFAQKISENIIFNQGDDLWNNYYEGLSLVNSDDVFNTVNRTSLLTPVVVIVGDREKLYERLKSFEEVVFYDQNGIQKDIMNKEIYQ
jgi:predicted Zn-dependent peptidase